jgi:AcrR family transcriptional regulator
MTSTREQIIHSTLNLVNERGLSDVTIIDIARAAGVARQTLYNHYADVDSIVADAISRHNDDSIQQIRSAVAVVETSPDKIEQLTRHIAQITAAHSHTIDLDHSLAPHHRAALSRFTDALEELIADIIIQGQHDGSFRRDLDLDIDAALVRQLLTGISNLVTADPDMAATIATTATRTILAALANP